MIELDALLTDETLVLTPNGRLARALRSRLLAERASAGRRAWRTPRIEALQQAMRAHWQDSWPVLRLLHPAQAQALFKHVIDNSEAANRLVATRTASRLALDAERLRRHHCIPVTEKGFENTPEG